MTEQTACYQFKRGQCQLLPSIVGTHQCAHHKTENRCRWRGTSVHLCTHSSGFKTLRSGKGHMALVPEAEQMVLVSRRRWFCKCDSIWSQRCWVRFSTANATKFYLLEPKQSSFAKESEMGYSLAIVLIGLKGQGHPGAPYRVSRRKIESNCLEAREKYAHNYSCICGQQDHVLQTPKESRSSLSKECQILMR